MALKKKAPATTATATTESAASFHTIGVFDPTIVNEPAGLYIEGNAKANKLYGSSASDTIYGLGGNDTLYGQSGNDEIFGDAGNDFLFGGAGADRLNGGDGIDTASYSTSATGVTVDLAQARGFNGEAQGDTMISIENVQGSSYADTLIGDAGSNTLWGGIGSDQLNGDIGDDILVGGTENDTLTGDRAGYFGRDTFVVGPKDGMDTITDFQKGFDKIGLSGFSAAQFSSDSQIWKGYLGRDGLQISERGVNSKLMYLSDGYGHDFLVSFDSLKRIGDNPWHMKGVNMIADLGYNTALDTSDLAII